MKLLFRTVTKERILKKYLLYCNRILNSRMRQHPIILPCRLKIHLFINELCKKKNIFSLSRIGEKERFRYSTSLWASHTRYLSLYKGKILPQSYRTNQIKPLKKKKKSDDEIQTSCVLKIYTLLFVLWRLWKWKPCCTREEMTCKNGRYSKHLYKHH